MSMCIYKYIIVNTIVLILVWEILFIFCTNQNVFYHRHSAQYMATLDDIGEISQEEISSEGEGMAFVIFYEGIITIIIIGG